MFGTLVVPLDGSNLAERALPYAVRLARAGQGRLILVRVAVPPSSMRLEGADWEGYQHEDMDDAAQYLSAIAAQLGDEVPVETVVPYGGPAVQILEQVRQLDSVGIVMATHGRTGLTHLLYGSVAESVLAESPVPVFLVHARPGKPVECTFDPQTARLMVPLDGSTFAEAALELALDLLRPASELVLIRVVSPPDHVLRDEHGRALAYLDQQADSSTSRARGYLEDVARRLRQKDPDIHLTLDVRMDEPDNGIIDAAAERSIDLLIMATHGRSGLRQITMGSVAGDVLHKGHTPILLVRPVMPHEPVLAGIRP
jgi:nucleotide-binding universal stress UspA family protein